MRNLYTIGYQSVLTVDELSDIQVFYRALVIDIRFSAYSHNQDWRRHSLEANLQAGYLYMQAFGNKNYKNGGPIELYQPERGAKFIERHIQPARSLILLCACYGHEDCHRNHASEFLATRWGLVPQHLYGSKKAPKGIQLKAPTQSLVQADTDHQMSMF